MEEIAPIVSLVASKEKKRRQEQERVHESIPNSAFSKTLMSFAKSTS